MNDPDKLTCWDCQSEFSWKPANPYQTRPRLCLTCTEVANQTNVRASMAKAREAITKLTPARFRTTDTNHPDFMRPLWERAKQWNPSESKPWLGLIGPTGTCKSRVAFMVFYETALSMIVPTGNPDTAPRIPSMEAVSAYQLAQAVSDLASDTKKIAADFLRRVGRVRILLIDDLGKQRNTPAMTSHLFAILDARHAENLPTIWTSNLSPQEIVAGMPDDMSAPLAGRILECSTIISTE